MTLRGLVCRLKTGLKTVSDRLAAAAVERKRLLKRNLEFRRVRRIRRKTVPAYKYCKNCGTELQGMYCHRCGQYALDIKQPFWKYILQYFENVYQFDGKVWVTLWMLIRRPGFLTTEFNAGKIASYVHPMRLLMFITVVFFIFFFMLLDDTLKSAIENTVDGENYEEAVSVLAAYNDYVPLAKDTVVALAADSSGIAEYPELFDILECSSAGRPGETDTLLVKMPSEVLSSYFSEKGTWNGAGLFGLRRTESSTKVKIEYFKDRMLNAASGYAPLIALLLTPVLGLLLKGFYRKKKMPYMSHLVFAMHWSSFLFLLVSVFIIVGDLWHYQGAPAQLFLVILLLYTTAASHWVYSGTGWIKTFIKTVLLLFIYFMIVLIVLGVLFGTYLYFQKQDIFISN